MHVVIRHYVNDASKWDRTTKNIMSMIEQHRLPAGLKPLEYLPSVDGRATPTAFGKQTPWARSRSSWTANRPGRLEMSISR
jgi:hypothetical protein